MPTIPMDLSDVMAQIAAFVFSLWPLIFLSIFADQRRFLANTLTLWFLLLLARLFLWLKPTLPTFTVIPEPLSTWLFLLVGVLLIAANVASAFRRRRAIRGIANRVGNRVDLLAFSPSQFEDAVVELLRAQGYTAQRTGATGDHGVDVRARSGNGEIYVAQCKRWRGAVGEPVVRDFYGVMQHEKADKGAIFTTGTFTRAAQEWARGKPIELYDGERLQGAWPEVSGQSGSPLESTHAVTEGTSARTNSGETGAPLCPSCQVPMVKRIARRGRYSGQPFYGCVNYPDCREILPLPGEVLETR